MSAPNKYGSNRIKAQVVWDTLLLDGGDYIADTGTYAGPYCAIQALAAVVVATMSNYGTALTTVPIPAGTTIYGNFTNVTFTSGKALAYK